MNSKSASKLTASFLLKVLLPGVAFAIVTYVMLGYAYPNMLQRIRLFFSAIWVVFPLLVPILTLFAKRSGIDNKN